MDRFLNALSAQYFEKVSKSILDDYFTKYGFILLVSNKHRVVYNRSDIYLEIYYYPEDSPSYSLMIGIGFIKENNDSIGFNGTGLWYALPADYDYNNWSFTSKEELERSIKLICNCVLERFAKPLWENPDKLQHFVDAQLNESKMIGDNQRKQQILIKAKHAFKSNAHNDAVELFEMIGVEYLTNVERKMYNICKKQC